MGLMDRAKEAAGKAAEAAQKGLDEAKTTGEKAMLKRKATGVAAQLGEVVFRQRNGEAGLDAEIDRLVAELREHRDQLERLHGDPDFLDRGAGL